MMDRRTFMQGAAAAPIIAAMPSPMAALTEPVGRWYAVGNGEMAYPFWATSPKDAVAQYAAEWGATLGDDCPECGAVECNEHIAPGAMDDPQPWIDVDAPKNWTDLGQSREPTNVDWVRAGYNVPCAHCNDAEPIECCVFEGEALCGDCLVAAREDTSGTCGCRR